MYVGGGGGRGWGERLEGKVFHEETQSWVIENILSISTRNYCGTLPPPPRFAIKSAYFLGIRWSRDILSPSDSPELPGDAGEGGAARRASFRHDTYISILRHERNHVRLRILYKIWVELQKAFYGSTKSHSHQFPRVTLDSLIHVAEFDTLPLSNLVRCLEFVVGRPNLRPVCREACGDRVHRVHLIDAVFTLEDSEEDSVGC